MNDISKKSYNLYKGKVEPYDLLNAPRCADCGSYKSKYDYFPNSDVWVCMEKRCLSCEEVESLFNPYPGKWFYEIQNRRKFINAARWNFFKEKSHVDHVWDQQAAKGWPRPIWLEGTYGVGKTYALLAFLRDLYIKRFWTAKYLSEEQMFAALKNCMETSTPMQPVLKPYMDSEFLIYDDLGVCEKTLQGDWGKQVLMELINHRYENDMKTLYASNLDDMHLNALLGERVVDRLREAKRFKMVGESLRKQLPD